MPNLYVVLASSAEWPQVPACAWSSARQSFSSYCHNILCPAELYRKAFGYQNRMLHVELRWSHLVVLLAAPLRQESVDEEYEGRPRHQPRPAPHQRHQGSRHLHKRDTIR